VGIALGDRFTLDTGPLEAETSDNGKAQN